MSYHDLDSVGVPGGEADCCLPGAAMRDKSLDLGAFIYCSGGGGDLLVSSYASN